MPSFEECPKYISHFPPPLLHLPIFTFISFYIYIILKETKKLPKNTKPNTQQKTTQREEEEEEQQQKKKKRRKKKKEEEGRRRRE